MLCDIIWKPQKHTFRCSLIFRLLYLSRLYIAVLWDICQRFVWAGHVTSLCSPGRRQHCPGCSWAPQKGECLLPQQLVWRCLSLPGDAPNWIIFVDTLVLVDVLTAHFFCSLFSFNFGWLCGKYSSHTALGFSSLECSIGNFNFSWTHFKLRMRRPSAGRTLLVCPLCLLTYILLTNSYPSPALAE